MRDFEKEAKMPLDPLFPRLHLNCTEQGGPRAPPRNKMALCGQVNSPSGRLSSGTMPMPMPSLPTSTGHCQKVNGTSLLRSAPELDSHKTGRIHSNCSDGMKAHVKYRESQIFRSGYYKAVNTGRPLRMIHPYRYYHSLNSSAKLHLKEDDSGISYFERKETALNDGMVAPTKEREHSSSPSLHPSENHKTATGRPEWMERTNVISRKHFGNRADSNSRKYEMSDERGETFHPLPSSDHNVYGNADLGVLAVYRNYDSGNREHIPLQNVKSRFLNGLSTLHDSPAQMHQEGRSLLMKTTRIEIVSGDPERLLRKRSSTAMEGQPGENNRRTCRIRSVNEVERSSAISETSVVDSTSHPDITPEVMMRVIGPNFFWKVRTTIDHHQRIFASQIFELHRLIKVQRFLAGSPKMLMEGSAIFSKPSANLSRDNKLQMKVFPEPPVQLVKPKLESSDLEACPDYTAEHTQGKLPATDHNKKDNINPNPIIKPESFVSGDTKFGPYVYKPPSGAYQWLVPVRSPSEGLVYKPYTGPCPPLSPGSIASVCGSHGTTLSLTRMDATAYVNTTTYVFPASDQQHGIVIYPGPGALAHSHEMNNTYIPDSAVMQQFGAAQSSGQYIIPYTSHNLSQGSETITDSDPVSPVLRGGDVQGIPGEGLPLFPTTPEDQTSRYSDQDHQNSDRETQVIKVVPHNSFKSASESAARIFQRIQEERRKHD